MVQYYIIIRKKNKNRFEGALKVKKGVSLARLRVLIKQISPNYTAKIITQPQLMQIRARIKASKNKLSRKVKRTSKMAKKRKKSKR